MIDHNFLLINLLEIISSFTQFISPQSSCLTRKIVKAAYQLSIVSQTGNIVFTVLLPTLFLIVVSLEVLSTGPLSLMYKENEY